MDDSILTDALRKGSYASTEDLQRAEEYARVHRTSIAEHLLAEGVLTKDLIGQAMAEHYSVPYADLNSHPPSAEQVHRIPERTAREHRAVLFEEGEKQVTITTDDPKFPHIPKGISSPARVILPLPEGEREGVGAVMDALQKLFPDKKILLAYSLTEDIDATFRHYRKSLDVRFTDIIAGEHRVAPELLEAILDDAIGLRASDVHLEPQGEHVLVRFRIDGVLRDVGELPRPQYDRILNRIKVEARLRIDEHVAAQDGAMRYTRVGNEADLRISIAPTLEGEKVVLRVLAAYVRSLALGDLGLSETNHAQFTATAARPFGMIIVTGPTGSGKTTTLYALLKELNDPGSNITTIEDPVEYHIARVNQIPVNASVGLTFARGLRSIVRQDPDVILVGEIRDAETAEIAVNAALTGHLLLSTFHANDAATAIPRLLDMGVEPFLLSSTLELIVAQRLVRRICEGCRTSAMVDRATYASALPQPEQYFPEERFTAYRGKGCPSCQETGYHGRIGIFECIRMTPELRDRILQRPSAQEVWALARSQGTQALFDDGLEKVKNGVTTLEELLRVAAPPDADPHADQKRRSPRKLKPLIPTPISNADPHADLDPRP